MKTESTMHKISDADIVSVTCNTLGIAIGIDEVDTVYLTLAELREAVKRCELHHDVAILL